VSRFIEDHRGRFGVEPICTVLGVSASAYYQRASGQRSRRAVQDDWLLEQIERVHSSTTTPMAIAARGRRSRARASAWAVTESSG
jgi:hypothetical protein